MKSILAHRSNGKANVPPPASQAPPVSQMTPAASNDSRLCRDIMAFANDTDKLIRKLYQASHYNPIATAEHLHSLGVHCSPMSLNEDGATSLVQPIPLQTVKMWLAEARPWEIAGRGVAPSVKGYNYALRNSECLCHDLASFGYRTYKEREALFKNSKKSDESVPDVRQRANYKRRLFHPQIIGTGRMKYGVMNIYHYADPACPHVSALLTEDMALPDSQVTLFELFVMMELTKMRAKDGIVNRDGIIPITLISMGDCRARVLHGYFEPAKRRINLKVSNVAVFDKPGLYMTDDWFRLLCWLYAQPVVSKEGRY